MKRIYVTIDTEMDANKHWKKMWPPEYSSIYKGIPEFYRPIWDKYDVHPIYFLSPEILYDDKCCDIIREEITKGAIIGAHLHPEYIDPDICYEEGRQTRRSMAPCNDCTTDIERAKIKNLTDLIENKLGIRPEWYRAARFAADDETYTILDEMGYKYDSSVTPGIDWSDRGSANHLNAIMQPYKIAGTSITEYPITIEGKRLGVFGGLLPNNWIFYRWLRPTHMTYLEMKNLLKRHHQRDNVRLVMMFHSMEVMINKTPYVRWKWMQKYYLWRLDKILKYATREGYLL